MKEINNFTENNDNATKCFNLRLIAYYLIFLFVFGLLTNLILIFIFITNKKLRIPLNIFVMVLCVFNLAGVLLELPPVISKKLT
jgi:hypothetical protein